MSPGPLECSDRRIATELPGGFYYWPEFISVREELELLKAIKKLKFASIVIPGYFVKRRMNLYGFEYSFESGRMTLTESVPEFLAALGNKISEEIGIVPAGVGRRSMAIVEYREGAGIAWHRDEGPFDDVIGVSLSGSCTLRLRSRANKHKIVSIRLQRRSAYILTASARWDWEHRIPPTKTLRYAVIYRTLLESDLGGPYPVRPKR